MNLHEKIRDLLYKQHDCDHEGGCDKSSIPEHLINEWVELIEYEIIHKGA